ncbi:hypothetical protein BH09BAC1_BH09BAC1_07310 [soil metagenome]
MNSKKIALKKLFLDPNNYRLRSKAQYKEIPDLNDDKITGQALQQRTFNILSGKNNVDIKDLMDSFMENGFLKVDNILVRKLDNGEGYVVIEGNRRVAALKVLYKSYLEGFDIGALNPKIFDEPDNDNAGLEVVIYNYDSPEDYLILMGLRHVSGNKKWDRYNQAKLIAELHQQNYTVSKIAGKLGITDRNAVQLQLDAYYAIQDFLSDASSYDSPSNFNPHDRFMIFVEVLLKKNVREWLGWSNTGKKFGNSDRLKRFYTWITPTYEVSDEHDAGLNDGELLDPIIVNHKQIRLLNEIIDDEDSLERMEDNRDIQEAIDQSEGYTKKKFSKEIKRAESILKNIKFGPTLEIESNDEKCLENISSIVSRILSSK